MSLSDLFVHSGTILPQTALVIFLGVFLAVIVRTVRRPRDQVRRWAALPLETDRCDVAEMAAPEKEPSR